MASVTGSNPSRSYWQSTDTDVSAIASAIPFSKSGSCSTPAIGRSAQLMSTATRSPGNPSWRQAAICSLSQPVACLALNAVSDSSRLSDSGASRPAATAGAASIPRRDSSEVTRSGPAALSHTTFRPPDRPSRTNAAVRSNSSSGSPNVRHA